MNACIEMPFGIKMVITCQFLLIFLPSCYNTLECSVNFIFIVRQLLFGIFLVFFCKNFLKCIRQRFTFQVRQLLFWIFLLLFFQKKMVFSMFLLVRQLLFGFFQYFFFDFFGEKKPFPNSYFDLGQFFFSYYFFCNFSE